MNIFQPKDAAFYAGRWQRGPSQLAIVHVTNVCNLNCVFCLERADRGGPQVPGLDEVRQSLAGLRGQGSQDLVFMGAETLLRKDALEVIGAARAAGFRHIMAATNGTPLARRGYLERLAEAGLTGIELSIHAATAEVADRIAGTPHTFVRQAEALAALARVRAVDLTINTVICRDNAGALADIAAHVRAAVGPERPVRFKFIFTRLQGCAWQDARDHAALQYRDVDFVALADRLEARREQFHVENVPLCRLGHHAARSLKLKSFATEDTFLDRALEANAYRSSGFQLDGNIWPAQPCGACALRPVCQGVEEQYARLVGTADLRASNRAPLDLLREALEQEGRDPREAGQRLEVLRQAPRPQGVVSPLKPGIVRLSHAELPEPLELHVQPRQEGARCYARTARLDVSYRPWSAGEVTAHARARTALERALAVLDVADAGGLDAAAARAAVCAQVLPGWHAELG